MLKKLLAGVATLALSLGMIAVTATSASAHHNTINAYVTCTTDFKFQINWTVENSEADKTEQITASSDVALVPVGTALAASEIKTFTEVVASPINKTLTLSAKWSNNATNTAGGSISKDNFGACDPQHVPVSICHATPPATAANGWVALTPDDDSIDNHSGHGDHDADIIPAFTYWANVDGVWTQKSFPGKNLDTLFSGFTGQQILDSGCSPHVAATGPTLNTTVCLAQGVVGDGSFSIPSDAGVTYTVRYNNAGSYSSISAGTYSKQVGTFVEVKAAADPSWVTLMNPKYWSISIPAPTPSDCIFTSIPVAPDVTTITECGMYGSVVAQGTEGVVYEFTIGDGTAGAWEITATPASGYKFTGSQSVTFSGDVGKHTLCANPTPPKFADSKCIGLGVQTGGTYTIDSVEGVRYQVKIGDGSWANTETGTFSVTVFPASVQIRAIAEDGYTLTDYDEPYQWTFTSAGECLTLVTPVAPDVTNITQCGEYGSISPQQTEGVVYELTVGGGQTGEWEMIATPAAGYYFDGEQTGIYSGNLGTYTDCVEPLPPTFGDSACRAGELIGGSYVIPEQEGVHYTVSINGGAFTDVDAGTYLVSDGTVVNVVALANPGSTITGDAEWPHTFTEVGECLKNGEPVAPTLTKITECGTYGSVMPAETVGVVYTLTQGDGKSGAWELTATPADGYKFEGPQEVIFNGNLGEHTDCAPSLRVKFTDSQCFFGEIIAGSFTIPEVNGLEYSVSINGEVGSAFIKGDYDATDGDVVEVTATALPGYTLTGDRTWSHTFTNVGDCELPTFGLAVPSVTSSVMTCSANGSYTVGGAINAEHVVWTLQGNSTMIPFGTYPVTTSQTITLVATSDDPVHYGLTDRDSNEWVNPIVLTFIKPGVADCGQLATLAFTGSTGSTLGLAVAGGLLFLGVGGIYLRRRFGATDK